MQQIFRTRFSAFATIVFLMACGGNEPLPKTTQDTAELSTEGGKRHREFRTWFEDIAADGGAGIDYRRTPSARYADIRAIIDAGGVRAERLPQTPVKARGAPGVVLFDFDRDGDLDIYVTNGPGQANSLYRNRLIPDGDLSFEDVAGESGTDATDADGTGACFGDIDNDGDHDLLVLAYEGRHSLFENQGNGTFEDIWPKSGLASARGAMSCAMGDVNGDGLLDLAIAHAASLETGLALFSEPFALNVHNQLFLNEGQGHFRDVSTASGVEALDGIPAGEATVTWAVTIVDLDLDGDQDIIFVDDQAGVPTAAEGGVDRGFIQLLDNDGSGHFTARAISTPGLWMGLAVADLNCDGHLDVFGSNFGDYGLTAFLPNYQLGAAASRWLLGRADGGFDDPGVGALVATPFGWGASALDYDNDGDADLLFHGGMDLTTILEQSNAGALLSNRACSAEFSRDVTAFERSTNHADRTVQGIAVGDVNLDGFVDVVSVSSVDAPRNAVSSPYPAAYGSVFDEDGKFLPVFLPTSPDWFAWSGTELENGTLSVEISDGNRTNGWVAFELVGTAGLTEGGAVNRDGIGATLKFTPQGGRTTMRPVLGGASYASQDSLTANFGLGRAEHGFVEVIWPSGVKNRLYGVQSKERLRLPEIPCSFDGAWPDSSTYRRCVRRAISDLIDEKILTKREGRRLKASAFRAYRARRTERDAHAAALEHDRTTSIHDGFGGR